MNVTKPDDIKRRIAKFKRRAPHIIDQEHFDVILASFPLDIQPDIYAEVLSLITRFKPVLNEIRDRIPFSASKEFVQEIKDRRVREEKERKERELKEEEERKKREEELIKPKLRRIKK